MCSGSEKVTLSLNGIRILAEGSVNIRILAEGSVNIRILAEGSVNTLFIHGIVKISEFPEREFVIRNTVFTSKQMHPHSSICVASVAFPKPVR